MAKDLQEALDFLDQFPEMETFCSENFDQILSCRLSCQYFPQCQSLDIPGKENQTIPLIPKFRQHWQSIETSMKTESMYDDDIEYKMRLAQELKKARKQKNQFMITKLGGRRFCSKL